MLSEGGKETLEERRAAYNQRKKATNSLITTLSGVNTALNKAHSSLQQYTLEHSTVSSEILAHTQETFATLRLKDEAIEPLLAELRREVKAVTELESALKDALNAFSGESVDVIKLEHACKIVQETTIEDPTIAAILPELEQELQQAQNTLGTTFGEALRTTLLNQYGIEIGGRPPNFEIGRFAIDANFVNRTATIRYGKDVTTKRVPLSVESVIKAYQRDAKLVTGRQEDGQRWIAHLYEAYEHVCRKRGQTGGRANIVECYVEMALLRQSKTFRSEPSKRGFREYSRAQFAYDFFEFTNEQRCTHEGKHVVAHVATKSHSENVARSIWIVEGKTPNEGNYISDMVFTADE